MSNLRMKAVFSCPLHISYTYGWILMKLCTNVHHHERMCRVQYSASQLQGQGHNQRSKVKIKYCFFTCPAHNFFMHVGISMKLCTNVHNHERMCRVQQPASQLQGQGHNQRSKVKMKAVFSCPLHISYTYGRISIIFCTNVHHYERMCRVQHNILK